MVSFNVEHADDKGNGCEWSTVRRYGDNRMAQRTSTTNVACIYTHILLSMTHVFLTSRYMRSRALVLVTRPSPRLYCGCKKRSRMSNINAIKWVHGTILCSRLR